RMAVEDALPDEVAPAVRGKRLGRPVVHLEGGPVAIADRDPDLQLLHPGSVAHGVSSLLAPRRPPRRARRDGTESRGVLQPWGIGPMLGFGSKLRSIRSRTSAASSRHGFGAAVRPPRTEYAPVAFP